MISITTCRNTGCNMKSILLRVSLFLLPGMLQAGVFKCETAEGFVSYQEQECHASTSQSTIEVEKTDRGKVAKAKQKLSKELASRAELESVKAEQARKDRELQLMEQRAKADQQLIKETRLQTQAIEKNTAVKEKSNSSRAFFSYPQHPIVKPPVINPPVVTPNQATITLKK